MHEMHENHEMHEKHEKHEIHKKIFEKTQNIEKKTCEISKMHEICENYTIISHKLDDL